MGVYLSDSPHVNYAVGLITDIKLVWTRDAQMERKN